ncbi:hypothetical protein [Chondromyces crocatus]|uniref:Lipoprotein n=1 Tax=Chondromyces crocatus TaxID=52 RepID=A0A0K1EKI5_CHOCO|nr:hypothetical protein [Chondromyces crocatus]AKT41088.1 uncharacterized protein CMC5_052470 [Chondromyces crocatus]
MLFRNACGAVVRTAIAASLTLLTACVADLADEPLDEAEILDEAVEALSQGVGSTAARAALALRWAPIHYQDVDVTGSHALGGRSDYISRVDFDGDWIATNNWENTPNHPLRAHAYHNVVETSSHWYIIYTFFHPRDWADNVFETEHENDAEGVLVIVGRDGSTYGRLLGAVTVAHKDFFSFVPTGSPFTGKNESVDGTLRLASHDGHDHPITAQEAKGHGLKAWPSYDIVGDGVKYYPSLTTAEEPMSAYDDDVRYKLIDAYGPEGFWPRRQLASLFASHGTFAGDKGGGCGLLPHLCTTNAANAPWGWDDKDDGPVLRGEIATDPAKLTAHYFNVPSGFSSSYTFNPFQNIGADPNTP